jgi:hypothetical protein
VNPRWSDRTNVGDSGTAFFLSPSSCRATVSTVDTLQNLGDRPLGDVDAGRCLYLVVGQFVECGTHHPRDAPFVGVYAPYAFPFETHRHVFPVVVAQHEMGVRVLPDAV